MTTQHLTASDLMIGDYITPKGCTGKQKTAGGYKWKYSDKTIEL